MKKVKVLPPPPPLVSDAFKLLVGGVSTLAGIVIFYLSISDAAAEGSNYETRFYDWVFNTSASTYPGLAMLLCGLCFLFEVASTDSKRDLSQARIVLTWPAINSSLMLVSLYQDGVPILLANITQTIGIMLMKMNLPLPRHAVLFTRAYGHLCVVFSVVPLIVALAVGRHWHVILVVTLYLATMTLWAALRHIDGVELVCEAVNVMCVPWLMWSLFSVSRGEDHPSRTVTI